MTEPTKPAALLSGNPILLVEDNEDDAFIMQTVFKKLKIPVPIQVVKNGEEAMAYLSGTDQFADRTLYPLPTTILLDLNMPRVNGFEFLRWVRQQPALKRIIVEVLTASNRPGDVERAFDAGANNYFVKPSRMEDLAQMIECWHRLGQFRALPALK